MNAPLKQAGLALACCLPLLLAACGSSSSDSTAAATGPTLNVSLSQPNLQTSMEPGDSGNFFVFFSGATSEELATTDGNTDNLKNVTLDTTGATGKVTIAPVTGTMPGIYSLLINGDVSGATTAAILNVNIYPTGNLGGHPTILKMSKDATQPATGVNITVTLPDTDSLRNGLNLISGSAQLVVPAGTKGITVNSVVVTAAPTTNNPDAVTIKAGLTVTPSAITPGTVTDAAGNTYSHGLELALTATPPSNGFSEQSYVELVYIDNLTTL